MVVFVIVEAGVVVNVNGSCADQQLERHVGERCLDNSDGWKAIVDEGANTVDAVAVGEVDLVENHKVGIADLRKDEIPSRRILRLCR
jgi:hypothetical protein